MSDALTIAQVAQNLPSWRTSLPAVPWDDSMIGSILDTNNQNVLAAVRLFWVQRVSDTQPLTDVRDTSATRPLSQDHDQAVKMLQYWDQYIEVGHSTRNGKIRKRYLRRRGLNILPDQYGYGSPYARTD